MGENGVLAQLTKVVLERALDEELTVIWATSGATRRVGGVATPASGTTPKRVLTEIGPVEPDIPRDRNGGFEPVLIRWWSWGESNPCKGCRPLPASAIAWALSRWFADRLCWTVLPHAGDFYRVR